MQWAMAHHTNITTHPPITVVTRHTFETIDDPVVNGRCTDYITYPYFQADYRTNHDRSGAIQQGGGLGNWCAMRGECLLLGTSNAGDA